MIKCSFCGADQIVNAIFCTACGVYLQAEERQGGAQIVPELPATEEEESDTKEAPMPTIRLTVNDSGRVFELALNKIIHIGRLDPASDVFPEVDLTKDNGLQKGVSRRHTRIMRREHKVLVEDLGSINGTYVNGRRLPPYLPERLADEDQLQLGNLFIKVQLTGVEGR